MLHEYESSQPGPDEFLARQEISANLWATARTLPANQYEAIWLKYTEGMSIKDIAQIMNKTQVYVKVLLYRGRVAIGKRLKYTATENRTTIDQPAKANYRIHESAGV